MRTKDNRPAGQGRKEEKAQDIVVLDGGRLYLWDALPTIIGELPTITAIVRTTAVEKSLTVLLFQ